MIMLYIAIAWQQDEINSYRKGPLLITLQAESEMPAKNDTNFINIFLKLPH